MSVEIDTASSCTDLLDRLDAFLTKGHSLVPQYTGTGDGLITELIGTSSSILETVTVTFSSSTAFGVVGSVTGSMGTGTVGTPFSHAKLTFTIVAGGTPWASSDTIEFVMTPPWEQQRGVSGDQYIWKAPGNDDTGEIFVGALRFHDSGADYDNLRLGGFTGYDSGSTWVGQPGYMGSSGPILPLWSSSIPYWFIANGRRVIIIAKVSSSYECAYLGLITPYASPGQYPYPLAIGGSMAWVNEPATNSVNWRFSYVGIEHRAFPMSDHNQSVPGYGQLRLRKPDGQWLGFRSIYAYYAPGAIWPYSSTDNGNPMQDLRPNLDGSYPMFPVVLTEQNGGYSSITPSNVWGEPDGIRATTGHNNGAENTITEGRDTWLVMQNVTSTTKHDYFAVLLA